MLTPTKSILLQSLTLALCLYACNNGTNSDAHRLEQPSAATISVEAGNYVESWNLTTETTNKNFIEENIESIKLIPLETNDNCLIGSISDITLRGDTIIVADINKSGKVYLFNSEGKYISSIGKKGEGPGEYGGLNELQIVGDTISITDWLRWQIVSYPLSGGKPKVISLNVFHPDKTFVLNDTTIIAASSYIPGRDFALAWLNADGTVRDSARPFQYSRSFPAGKLQPANDGRLLYYSIDSDTVFEVTPSSLRPVYALGIQNDFYGFIDKTLNQDWPSFNKALYTGNDAPLSAFNIVETDNKWFIYYQKGPRNFIGVKDKNSDSSKSYLRADINERRISIPFTLYKGRGNTLITYFDYVFREQIADVDKEWFYAKFPYAKSIIDNYDFDNQNPLVCLLNLKE